MPLLLQHSPSTSALLPSNAPRRRGFLLSSTPPGAWPAANRVVLGCGLVTLGYLATVDAYPRPDDKIRSGELQISGGGNAGNALTGAGRLGLNTRLISKVANDEIGGTVLSDLKEAGIDISHVIISDGGNTTLVYVIIDNQTNCTSRSDRRQIKTFHSAIASKQRADQMNIPILVDAEPERTKE